jgi:hypothetical protein
MNPKAEGALEALSYIKGYLKALKANDKIKNKLDCLEAEIEELIELLLTGSSIDFKNRLKHF